MKPRPLALLLKQQYEFPFGINTTLFNNLFFFHKKDISINSAERFLLDSKPLVNEKYAVATSQEKRAENELAMNLELISDKVLNELLKKESLENQLASYDKRPSLGDNSKELDLSNEDLMGTRNDSEEVHNPTENDIELAHLQEALKDYQVIGERMNMAAENVTQIENDSGYKSKPKLKFLGRNANKKLEEDVDDSDEKNIVRFLDFNDELSDDDDDFDEDEDNNDDEQLTFIIEIGDETLQDLMDAYNDYDNENIIEDNARIKDDNENKTYDDEKINDNKEIKHDIENTTDNFGIETTGLDNNKETRENCSGITNTCIDKRIEVQSKEWDSDNDESDFNEHENFAIGEDLNRVRINPENEIVEDDETNDLNCLLAEFDDKGKVDDVNFKHVASSEMIDTEVNHMEELDKTASKEMIIGNSYKVETRESHLEENRSREKNVDDKGNFNMDKAHTQQNENTDVDH